MTSNDKPASGGADGLADSSLDRNDAKPSTASAPSKPVAPVAMELVSRLLAVLTAGEDDPADHEQLTQFLVRLFTDPVQLIGVAPPLSGDDAEVGRAAFWFACEPAFNSFTIRASLEPMRSLVVLVQARWECPVTEGQFWSVVGGA